MNYYIDTHFHLFPEANSFNFDPDKIVKGAIRKGVKEMWLASTNAKDIQKNLDFAKKYPKNLKIWVGYHPEHFEDYDKEFLSEILNSKFPSTNFQTNPKSQNSGPKTNYPLPNSIVGIGEIGMDLKWNEKSTIVEQQKIFEEQIRLAIKHNLPIAVHSRQAFKETFEVLERYPNLKLVWHCYNLGVTETKSLVTSFPNIFFGFNAIITYKSGIPIQESILEIPDNKILTETDAPFLPPRSFKSPYNTPEGVISVYQKLAQVKNIDLEQLEYLILDNSRRLTEKLKSPILPVGRQV